MRDLFELYPMTRMLISATVRNEDTLAAFLKACSQYLYSSYNYSNLLMLCARSEFVLDEASEIFGAGRVKADRVLSSYVDTDQCIRDYDVGKGDRSIQLLTTRLKHINMEPVCQRRITYSCTHQSLEQIFESRVAGILRYLCQRSISIIDTDYRSKPPSKECLRVRSLKATRLHQSESMDEFKKGNLISE